MIKNFKTDKESLTTIIDEKGELVAIIRRDPVSKKPVIHTTPVANIEQIVEFIESTEFSIPKIPLGK